MPRVYLESSELVTTDGITKTNIVTQKISALTAATTVTTSQSNYLFTLGTAGGFAVTLPAVSGCAGCVFEFIVKVAPSGGSYTIVTSSSENKIYGAILSKDLNAANDTSSAAASDTITLVDSKAQIGDRVTILSDGTYFYATAYTNGNFDSITFTQAS